LYKSTVSVTQVQIEKSLDPQQRLFFWNTKSCLKNHESGPLYQVWTCLLTRHT